jgi:hypothetical protein
VRRDKPAQVLSAVRSAAGRQGAKKAVTWKTKRAHDVVWAEADRLHFKGKPRHSWARLIAQALDLYRREQPDIPWPKLTASQVRRHLAGYEPMRRVRRYNALFYSPRGWKAVHPAQK